MGRFVLLSFFLLAQIFAMATRSDGSELNRPLKELVRTGTISDPPLASSSGATESSSEGEEASALIGAQAPTQIGRLGRRHSSDKSVAGGGVIIGGLVTAIFAAVYCYIRVTRRRADDRH